MATDFQPPPTWAEVILLEKNPSTGEDKPIFNPVWLKWFLDLTALIGAAGGGGGTAFTHNLLAGLQGGTTNEEYHLTATERTTLLGWEGNQTARYALTGPVSGAAAPPTFKLLQAVTYKPSDTSRASTTAMTDDPHLLFAIGANETWIGRTFLAIGADLNTTGIKVTIAAPAGASGAIHSHAVANTAVPTGQVAVLSTNTLGAALDFTTGIFIAGASDGGIIMVWRVANGATAGNISVQWAQSTSSVTNLTVDSASQMTSQRVA